MEFEDLVGKTITKAATKEVPGYDDEVLELEFSDQTKAVIVAGFGGYTGNSRDEYPTYLYIDDDSEKEEE